MTLNGEMALILRYFTEFGSFRGALRKSRWQSHNYGQFTITIILCLVVNVCRGTARRPRYKYSITARWNFCSRFINSRLNAQYLPSYHLYKKSYELSIGTKISDLEWTWTAKWPLFCVILPNWVVSGAHCVNVVDKAITMDNLRLLSLVVNVCKGTARRPWYKYSITAKWKFISSILNVQYLPSYRLIC